LIDGGASSPSACWLLSGAERGRQEILADSLGTWVLAPLEHSRIWFIGKNRAVIRDDVKGAKGHKDKGA
jgi:hypothetical protein